MRRAFSGADEMLTMKPVRSGPESGLGRRAAAVVRQQFDSRRSAAAQLLNSATSGA